MYELHFRQYNSSKWELYLEYDCLLKAVNDARYYRTYTRNEQRVIKRHGPTETVIFALLNT